MVITVVRTSLNGCSVNKSMCTHGDVLIIYDSFEVVQKWRLSRKGLVSAGKGDVLVHDFME